MTRLLAPVLLCATLAMAAPLPAAAAAGDDARGPKQLWEEFPLEPAATPAASATTSGARPAASATRAPEEEEGMSPLLLAALLAAAIGVGALATLTRRKPKPKAAAKPRAVAKPKPKAAAKPRTVAKPRSVAQPPNTRPRRPAPRPASLRSAAAEFRECRIELDSSAAKSHFYVIPRGGGPVLARSPRFGPAPHDGERALSAPEALSALVDELTARGWRQASKGRTPWDLRFERDSFVAPARRG